MDFLELLKSFLSSLGISTEKAGNKQMTPEEITKLSASVKEKTGMELNEFFLKVNEQIESAKKEDESKQTHQATLDTIAGIISTAIPSSQNAEGNNGEGGINTEGGQATSQQVIDAVQQMSTAFQQMANGATPQTPIATSAPIIGLNGPGTTATHFLGIPHSMYDRGQRWNEIAALGGHGSMSIDASKSEGVAYHEAVAEFGVSLGARYEYLRQEKKLATLATSNFDNDFSGLDPAKLGDQFLVRRQDALIAHLIKFYNIYNIFPRRYGIQDREVLFSAFFESVSQAYQEGEVFKGGMNLQPEMAHVDDAMIKVRFKPMKVLERMYIGYLNKEGSDPMKWSMIEWQLVNIMETAINEQNHRRLMGIYVHPEDKTPGHYLHASTGVFYTLFRYYVENKLKLHDDDSFCGYTKDTMLETVQDMIDQIMLDTSKDQTVKIKKGFRVVLNENHRTWWKKNCRTKYAEHTDFKGPDSMLDKVPDYEVAIVWLPNAGQLPWILFDEPGNIELLEYKAGEMLALQFDRMMETYTGYSTWKEGCGASFVGPHFNTKEDLDKNNYHLQRIFMNAPLLFIDADATTINGASGFWFRSKDNTAPTKLADIQNPETGVGYIIEAGDENNPTAIDKVGVFSEITANYVPTKKGDYIFLVYNVKTDKYAELERRVGGQRTINKKLQPNIIGAR